MIEIKKKKTDRRGATALGPHLNSELLDKR
jgi:hypothetical protein